ncbi:hypothetical protein GGI18_005636 [Coemansia linderi]|uniref:Uncharacterized protein n=1 Tax=Coemansia linderi TaxID=2663919 RepID=A0ACC1JVV9_9FUNG|nr:hypothetical protein GGI18_005636 [Coemansia linderi]
MGDCERHLRELDAIIQGWILVHRRSTSAASQLHNLHDQATKTLAQTSNSQPIQRLHLLLAMQISEKESLLCKIRSHVHEYATILRQLESLDERVGQHQFVVHEGVDRVAGITPQYVVDAVGDRRKQYTREYVRRRRLLEDLVVGEKIGVTQFSTEWVEAKIDYATEEDYLERLRLARMARQWEANCAESERLIS